MLPLKCLWAYPDWQCGEACLKKKQNKIKKQSLKIVRSSGYRFSHWHSKHCVGSRRFGIILAAGLIFLLLLAAVVWVSSHHPSRQFWDGLGSQQEFLSPSSTWQWCGMNRLFSDVLNSKLFKKCFLYSLFWYLLCYGECYEENNVPTVLASGVWKERGLVCKPINSRTVWFCWEHSMTRSGEAREGFTEEMVLDLVLHPGPLPTYHCAYHNRRVMWQMSI